MKKCIAIHESKIVQYHCTQVTQYIQINQCVILYLFSSFSSFSSSCPSITFHVQRLPFISKTLNVVDKTKTKYTLSRNLFQPIFKLMQCKNTDRRTE